MNRRDALRLLAAGSAVTAAGGVALWRRPMDRMPVLFLAHGAPPLLDDAGWMAELHAWARALPKPRAILMISAHWESRPVTLGATTTVPLVYDFHGFPQRFYEVLYPAPGAPELAARVRELLGEVAEEPGRGLDHGAFVPLLAMYPEADVPVLQVSMPSLDPRVLVDVGRKLAPLRDEGVLIVGSGFLTHNMRAFSQTTPSWAAEFDDWAEATLAARDVDALVDFERRAPGARIAHPRSEHYAPVVVAAGAAHDDAVTFPITGFWYGSFTRRSVQFG